MRLAGRNIAGLPPRDICRLGVGRTFQIAATFGSMTVIENVQMALIAHNGEAYRLWRPAAAHHREQAHGLLHQVGMAEAADRPCRELAYGDVKRVELAIALANAPRCCSWTSRPPLEPRERTRLIALVKRRWSSAASRRCSPSIPWTSASAFADGIIATARGRLIADGDAKTIRNDPLVQQVYFGTGKILSARSRGDDHIAGVSKSKASTRGSAA